MSQIKSDQKIRLAIEDARIFAQIYTRYYRLMYSIAWNYSRDSLTVEDIVSDSSIALMRKIDILKQIQESQLQAYISTTVKHTAINLLRKQIAEQRRLIEHGLDHSEENVDLIGYIEVREEYELVMNCINKLSDVERMIIQMRFFNNMSSKEIGDLMGLSSASIRTKLSRARKKIIRWIDKNAL